MKLADAMHLLHSAKMNRGLLVRRFGKRHPYFETPFQTQPILKKNSTFTFAPAVNVITVRVRLIFFFNFPVFFCNSLNLTLEKDAALNFLLTTKLCIHAHSLKSTSQYKPTSCPAPLRAHAHTHTQIYELTPD